jgi:putative Holliday junction resolvase
MTQPPPPSPYPRRLLCLDPGEKRTGVATSDELGLYAHARTAIRAASRGELLDAVAEIVAAEAVSEVVVGLPLSLTGEDSGQTNVVRELVAALRDRLAVPVSGWDERLSSVAAGPLAGRDSGGAVRGAVRKPRSTAAEAMTRRRSGELDSAAAAVVLQSVLDSRRARRPE